jgi:proteasome accessory factor A
MRMPLALADGGSATALEIQGRYLEWLSKYAENELDAEVWQLVLEEWAAILEDLDTEPDRCADRLDWVAKRRLLNAYVDRDSLTWDDPKLRLLDIQFHDIDPATGLYHRLAGRGATRRLFTPDQVEGGVDEPPTRTRAYFRGRCVSEFPDALIAANWDSLVFDIGEPHFKRIPMMEPLRGTEDLVGPLMDGVEDASGLIEALGG